MKRISFSVSFFQDSDLNRSCGSLPEPKTISPLSIMNKQELEYRALKLLESQPVITQRQIAKKLNVSLGKTHYLIKSLIDVGWVKLGNFQRSDNKLSYAYFLTPSGIIEKAVITAKFLARKQQEYSDLQLEIQQLQEEINQKQKPKQD
tara:strand:- start:1719 stop:2162 length:444 start_codon:yes stop_codon:yes gene_type:complete